MICPVCKTNNALNAKNTNTEFCVQCGADIYVHHLLREVQKDLKMKDEITKTEQQMPSKKTSGLFIALDSASSIVLIIVTVFALAAGFHFLTFLNHREYQRVSNSHQWSETGFEQLQEMNNTIKEELDLIMSEHKENQVLREKLAAINASTAISKINNAAQPVSNVASNTKIQGSAQ